MKTWSDVEEAAYHDPLLRDAVTLVRMGRLTREEALIHVALGHAEIRQRQFAEIMRYVNTSLPRILVLKEPLMFKGQPIIWDHERNTTEVWPAPSKIDPT